MQLPSDFTSLMADMLGEEASQALFASLEEPSPVSVRLNPRKPVSPDWLEGATPVPWCCGAYYLASHHQFTLDPLFHAGCYYVQEASSMFLDHALRRIMTTARESAVGKRGSDRLQVLDLCASPGGKSTDALGVLDTTDEFIANEVMPPRALVLADNIRKWGCPNARVTQNQPREFAKSGCLFDIVIADVPCSGEGMFRKKDAALEQWSLDYVKEAAALQRSIIADIWPCLRPGGFLIYSTCTYNPFEDEQNVQSIIETYGAESIDLAPEASWGILPAYERALTDRPSAHLFAYHLLPSHVQGEGFFLAVVRKPDTSEEQEKPRKRAKRGEGKLNILFDGNSLKDFPKEKVELSLMDARRYLRGESLILSPEVPRGLVAASYQGYTLGLMKNLGTRANNLYPKIARIRTTHIDA